MDNINHTLPPLPSTRPQYNDYANEVWESYLDSTADGRNAEQSSSHMSKIRMIIKGDPDIKNVAPDVSMVFGKSIEVLILDVTLRARTIAEREGSLIITKEHLAQVVDSDEQFSFFRYLFPLDNFQSNHQQQQHQPR